jgi:hypothetical protein
MSVAGDTVRQHDDHAAGILWMLATVFCFISLDTVMKELLETYGARLRPCNCPVPCCSL